MCAGRPQPNGGPMAVPGPDLPAPDPWWFLAPACRTEPSARLAVSSGLFSRAEGPRGRSCHRDRGASSSGPDRLHRHPRNRRSPPGRPAPARPSPARSRLEAPPSRPPLPRSWFCGVSPGGVLMVPPRPVVPVGGRPPRHHCQRIGAGVGRLPHPHPASGVDEAMACPSSAQPRCHPAARGRDRLGGRDSGRPRAEGTVCSHRNWPGNPGEDRS